MTLSLKKLAGAAAVAVTAALTAAAAGAADLKTQVFNPGEKSLFPVTSTLVTGPTEAVLIDAQFQRDDAQSVLKMIQDSGKDLKTIYISHGDPDFYFGLDVILDAYPNAKVVTSPETLKHIQATVERKISYWGPILKENAPGRTVMPELITGDSLTVDGEKLQIVGLDGHDPKHTYVWIPSLKTVTGGVVAYEGVHVWMADAQTADARFAKALDRLQPLLHNVATDGGTWAEFNVSFDRVMDVYRPVIEAGSKTLWQVALPKVEQHFSGQMDGGQVVEGQD